MKREYDFSKGRPGPFIPVPPGKTRITIRLDDDLLQWFVDKSDASGGVGYQTMINDALRRAVEAEQEPLEAVLRRVVRAELQRQVARKESPRRRRASK